MLSSQVIQFVTICSPFLFHTVLFSLHDTKFLGHNVSNRLLHKDCGEDAGTGGHAAELLEVVWGDGGARKAELPGQDVEVFCQGRMLVLHKQRSGSHHTRCAVR